MKPAQPNVVFNHLSARVEPTRPRPTNNHWVSLEINHKLKKLAHEQGESLGHFPRATDRCYWCQAAAPGLLAGGRAGPTAPPMATISYISSKSFFLPHHLPMFVIRATNLIHRILIHPFPHNPNLLGVTIARFR